MTDAEVLAAIRTNHLKANISGYEAGIDGAVIHWDRAWLDPGGTVFGSGPYAKVPITIAEYPEYPGGHCNDVVVRVYAPERLRKRIAARWTPPSVVAGP